VRFDVITLFPEMFRALEAEGVIARALEQGIAELHLWNPRDYTQDVHRTVDDRPYGGGPGMVMREPLRRQVAWPISRPKDDPWTSRRWPKSPTAQAGY